MSFAQTLLPQFDHEMVTTRKMLERYPEEKADWKPHPTSMTMGRLAGHVAEMVAWTVPILQQDVFEMDRSKYTPAVAGSRSELLQQFDETIKIARAAIAGTSDEAWNKPWAFIAGGREMFKMPKIAVIRSFVLSHTIHHRGQLSVYYRMNGVPVPSIYGPSADENP